MKKKLIEVALPLEAINSASIREKSIRHGHPSTLHLYWARRPLAACRAVLFAQLVDDPSSHPDKFPTLNDQERERERLFAIIEDVVKWENSTNEEVLERARAEIRRSCGGVLPPIYDPFSGGGSIPLEAQRLGLPAYGSDLNPVAVMIGKAMIEIPPKFKDMPPIHPDIKDRSFYRNAEGLAEDVKYYGERMREKALGRIGHLYPQADLPKEYGGGKATVVAWIWSRTVPSPDPAFSDVDVPITSSFLLSSKPGKEVWLEPVVDRHAKSISYKIHNSGTQSELSAASEGTKAGRGANFRCLISGSAITAKHITGSGKAGRIGKSLLAIVAESGRGRIFLPPNDQHVLIAESTEPSWKPDQKQPDNPRWFAPPAYGMETFGDLFTNRQLVGLNTYCELLEDIRNEIASDCEKAGMPLDGVALSEGGFGATGYADAVCVYLALGISRLSDISNAFCVWSTSANQAVHLFGRQAIPMVWSFAETSLFSDMAGDYRTSLNSIVKCLVRFTPAAEGFEVQADAQNRLYRSDAVISTDPPYYDNIGYADLSDFFYVWLSRCLRPIYPDIFSSLVTPKTEELVATPYRQGGKDAAEKFFLDGMSIAIKNMADNSTDQYPAAIYYAFKQSEVAEEGISSTGWATFLTAVIGAGYAVVGTWPLRTERDTGLKVGLNVLANSVVLVCRKRTNSAETVTRAEFIRALKRELPSAIGELQAANIAPADMPQSAIGPGMGVYSRYKAVLESDDSPMSVKTALQLINRELDEYLGGIQGEFDADTRFAITWFEQHGMAKGDYGAADNLARARGISVESVKHAGIVESAAGKVRILARDELDEDWAPESDGHLTVWECLQHLVRLHQDAGLSDDTARLLKAIGSKAEAAKDLAYCLYDIAANKRKDAKEATAYNALIADWTELSRQAAAVGEMRRDGQMRMEI
jgi:putative DNA methylase